MAVAPAPLPTTMSTGSLPSPCKAFPRPAGTSGGSRRGTALRLRRARTGWPPGHRRAGWRGPLLIRSGAFISAAMIMDVCLAQPGRTREQTWSALRPRIREASRTRESCLRTLCWPTKVVQVLGPEGGFDDPLLRFLPPATTDGSATGARPVPGAGAVLAQPAEGGTQDLGPLPFSAARANPPGTCRCWRWRPSRTSPGSSLPQQPAAFQTASEDASGAVEPAGVPCGTSFPAVPSRSGRRPWGPMPGTLVKPCRRLSARRHGSLRARGPPVRPGPAGVRRRRR